MPRAQRPEAGLTYLAGLLHNFGYLLLAHVFPPHFSLICRHLEVNPHLCHSYVEQHLLGISREQIGAWLMRYWDMPDELSTALRFQHDPTYDGQYAEYPNLVCLAVRLLRSRGIRDCRQCGTVQTGYIPRQTRAEEPHCDPPDCYLYGQKRQESNGRCHLSLAR